MSVCARIDVVVYPECICTDSGTILHSWNNWISSDVQHWQCYLLGVRRVVLRPGYRSTFNSASCLRDKTVILDGNTAGPSC